MYSGGTKRYAESKERIILLFGLLNDWLGVRCQSFQKWSQNLYKLKAEIPGTVLVFLFKVESAHYNCVHNYTDTLRETTPQNWHWFQL